MATFRELKGSPNKMEVRRNPRKKTWVIFRCPCAEEWEVKNDTSASAESTARTAKAGNCHGRSGWPVAPPCVGFIFFQATRRTPLNEKAFPRLETKSSGQEVVFFWSTLGATSTLSWLAQTPRKNGTAQTHGTRSQSSGLAGTCL